MKRIFLAAALGVVASLGSAAPAMAQNDNFTCRASLLRTEGFAVSLLNQEPVVANAQNNPCVAEDAALLDPLNPLTVGNVAVVRALYTQTTLDARQAEARSGAADAVITIPGAPTIRASALTSRAVASCGNGSAAPRFEASSNVLFLQIGDSAPLVNIDDQTTIPLPGGGQVILNQQTTTADSITQRALRVEVPGVGTVTVAESIADFRGNPCDNGGGGPGNGGGGDVPECSDEKDNDGDGKIDFPNDPGCDSPQDDDETDGGEEPECSDGEDNDNDGYVDYPRDPGCDDREDDDETDGPAECSDGRDNDGDKRTDFPADNGCKSPTDDDEAAGFMTGGGGYDETDKKILNEDFVDPGTSLRFGDVFPCDLGDKPGPSLNVTWHNPRLLQQVKLDSQSRAFCRNDPFISPGRPLAEFDTYVGEGSGTLRNAAGVRIPVQIDWVQIDRGEPGAPPVIGVDFFEIRVRSNGLVVGQGVGTLDHGNVQAHTPGSFRQKKTPN